MRWEDERYVRLYTRDTVNWTMLPWQAKCVLPLLLRKVDRAGVIELDGAGYEGIAALIQIPFEVVEPGIAALVSRGVVQVSKTALVLPKYIEAQEVSISDAQRKRDQRERARVKHIEKTETQSQEVTPCHEVSQAVTPNLTKPNLTKPNLTIKNPPTPLSGEAPAAPEVVQKDFELLPQEPKTKSPLEEATDEVMAYYVEAVGSALKAVGKKRARAQDSPEGRKHIRDRLTGQNKRDSRRHSVTSCKLAIDGLTWSDHHMHNGFHGIQYALRSSEQMEMLIARIPERKRSSG